MKTVKSAAVSVLMMLCSSAFAGADKFEGFWGNGWGSSLEITKVANNKYFLNYENPSGANDGNECEGTGVVEGGKLVPKKSVCTDYTYEGENKVYDEDSEEDDSYNLHTVIERRGKYLYIIDTQCNSEDTGECESRYEKFEKN